MIRIGRSNNKQLNTKSVLLDFNFNNKLFKNKQISNKKKKEN